MKRLLFVMAALIISFNGYSQFFEIGPRFEVASTKFQLGDIQEVDQAFLEEASRDLGFKVGLYSRIKIGSIYLQPEVLFTSTGGRIEYTDDVQNLANQVIDLSYNRIDVPLMLGKKFGKVFRFNLGPILTYTISNNEDLPSQISNLVQDYNDGVVGYQIGIGFDISKIRLDVKYEGNLTKFGESITVFDNTFNTDYRPNMFTFGLAFNLL
jgi:hypothetical protein